MVKKYAIVAFLGVLAITSASAADISGYLRGVVHGIGLVFLVYGLYKSVTASPALKKQTNNKKTKSKAGIFSKDGLKKKQESMAAGLFRLQKEYNGNKAINR